jgi:hypothetical protein
MPKNVENGASGRTCFQLGDNHKKIKGLRVRAQYRAYGIGDRCRDKPEGNQVRAMTEQPQIKKTGEFMLRAPNRNPMPSVIRAARPRALHFASDRSQHTTEDPQRDGEVDPAEIQWNTTSTSRMTMNRTGHIPGAGRPVINPRFLRCTYSSLRASHSR